MFFALVFQSIYIWYWEKGALFTIPRGYQCLAVTRGVFGMVGLCSNYTAMMLIDLSKSNVLYWTNPIWVMILARIFLGERLSWIDGVAIIVTFAGVILTANPFATATLDVNTNQTKEALGIVVAIVGSIFQGAAYVLHRKLGDAVKYYQSPIFICLSAMAVMPIATMIFNQFKDKPPTIGGYEVGMCALISLFFMSGILCLSRAFQVEKAGRVAPINYSQIPIVFILDALILKANFTWQEVLGSALIFGSNVTVSVLKACQLI